MLSRKGDDKMDVEPLLYVVCCPVRSDLINFLNGLQSILSKIPVISLRPISLSLKLEGRILFKRRE